MAIVPAKCTSCGGTLKVRAEDKTAICPFCGTEYLVQEAIEQYNITNVYNIEKASLTLDHRKLFNDRIEAAEKQLRMLKDYPKALAAFTALENDIPEEFRIWSGKLEAQTREYNVAAMSNMHMQDDSYINQLTRDYENAYITGDNEQKKEINEKFLRVLKKSCENIGLAGNVLENNAKKRQKYRDKSNVITKIGAAFMMIAFVLGGLALLVTGFLAMVFTVFLVSEFEAQAVIEALIVIAIAFTPAVIVSIPVIILSIISKKIDKKDEEISNSTLRTIKGELQLDLPGFVHTEDYYNILMLCRKKESHLVSVIKKYTIS